MKQIHGILASAAAVAAILCISAFILAAPHSSSLPVVAIVYDGEKGDLSYTDSAYRGLFSAQDRMAFDKAEFPSMENFLDSGLINGSDSRRPGLVITVGYPFRDTTFALAREHPQVQFLAIDQAGSGPANVRSVEITSYGESYLAGVLAATATKTGRVGIILGTQSDLLDGFRQGFIDGVRASRPDITIDEQYVRDNSTAGFSDPARAQEIARGMYGSGVDVIYTVAGFSGSGAIMEAKKAPGRFIIGVDADQAPLGPSVVLASAVKRLDRIVYTGIAEHLKGSFSGGDPVVGLEDGVTDLVFNPKFEMYNRTVRAWEERARDAEYRYIAGR